MIYTYESSIQSVWIGKPTCSGKLAPAWNTCQSVEKFEPSVKFYEGTRYVRKVRGTIYESSGLYQGRDCMPERGSWTVAKYPNDVD